MQNRQQGPDGQGGLSQIPEQLRQAQRWCRWEEADSPTGRKTKRPIGSTLDPNIRLPFETVAGTPCDEHGGVGFVLTGSVQRNGLTFICLDLDGCRDPLTGSIEAWAMAVVRRTGNSYTEVTPSGCGLHVWFALQGPPPKLGKAKVKVPYPLAPNCPHYKPVELQVFGYGVAQYVTMTGERLPGTSDQLEVMASLDWLIDEFHLRDTEHEIQVQLPRSSTKSPTLDQIEEQLRRSPEAAQLIDGDWQPAVRNNQDKTASGAFSILVGHVLQAAHNDGETAVQFLLERTAFGLGTIDDSYDASKYSRLSWVKRDVARVASKSRQMDPRLVFEPVPVFEIPPEVLAARKAKLDGLLIPARDFLANQTAEQFLVHGLLPRTGLAEFFGKPACGKTPFAMSLAVHVATGKPTWFGHDIDLHGHVVYMIGEDRTGVRNRLQSEYLLHGVALDADVPLLVTRRPGQLTDAGDVKLWREAVENTLPEDAELRLLVVDTQARNFGPGNEDKTEDMSRFVNNVQDLADALGCLVLLVHHSGLADDDRGRGNSSRYGALDASYKIVRTHKTHVTALSLKEKNWDTPEPLCGRLQVFQLGLDPKGRPITSVGLDTSTPDAPAAEDAFTVEAEELSPELRVLQVAQVVDGVPLPPAEVARMAGYTSASSGGFRRALDRAVEAGLIEVRRTGVRRAARLAIEPTVDGMSTLADHQQRLERPEHR